MEGEIKRKKRKFLPKKKKKSFSFTKYKGNYDEAENNFFLLLL